MKNYKLKQLTKKQKIYLKQISLINVIYRSFGIPEIGLELHDWFEEDRTPYFNGEITNIKINGREIK